MAAYRCATSGCVGKRWGFDLVKGGVSRPFAVCADLRRPCADPCADLKPLIYKATPTAPTKIRFFSVSSKKSPLLHAHRRKSTAALQNWPARSARSAQPLFLWLQGRRGGRRKVGAASFSPHLEQFGNIFLRGREGFDIVIWKRTTATYRGHAYGRKHT